MRRALRREATSVAKLRSPRLWANRAEVHNAQSTLTCSRFRAAMLAKSKLRGCENDGRGQRHEGRFRRRSPWTRRAYHDADSVPPGGLRERAAHGRVQLGGAEEVRRLRSSVRDARARELPGTGAGPGARTSRAFA